MASGRPQDGLAELERATSSPLLTGTERSGALGWASIARMWLGDLDGCEATAEEAGAAARTSGDHMTTTIASSMSAIVSLYHGQLGRAAELIDGAVRAADRSPHREGHRYPVHVARGYVLIELDRLADARATLEAGSRIGEELGLGWHQGSYHVPSIMQYFVTGQWDEAVAEVEASIELAAGTGESFGLLVGRSVLALISLQAGTGLFANDDGDTEGPLFHLVGKDRSDWLSHIHSLNFKLIEAAIVLHIVAIACYAWLKRQNLVRPMVTGTKLLPRDTPAPRLTHPVWAAAVVVVAAGTVAYLIRL